MKKDIIRIVSWNMNHWARSAAERRAAWEFLRSLNPTYAVVQEAVPPPEFPADRCVYRPGGIGRRRPWGSAVVSFAGPITEVTSARSRFHKRATDIVHSHAGSAAVAATSDDLTLISMYGVMDDGYAVTSVQRVLSDLTPLLDSEHGKRVVLAGDWNLSTQLEEPHRSRHRNVFDRLGTLGLVDALSLGKPHREPLPGCPCADNACRHVRTHRHRRSAKPWQDDYVYVSRSLAPAVTVCDPVEGGSVDPWTLSDHCPLVVELRADNRS